MAAPVYATDLATILLEFPSTTGWSALGGGAAGLNAPETDYFIQNANCISKNAWASALKGMIYSTGGTISVPTDGAVILFLAHATMNSVATQANGGLRVILGSGTSDYDHWYVGGSDTEVFGLWNPYPVNDTVTPDTTTGTPGTYTYVGALANLPSGGPTKGSPFAIDAIRVGRCRMDVTDGDAGNGYATFAGLEATANSLANRWGLFELIKGTYLMQGFLRLGITGGNAVDFRDSNRVIYFRDATRVTSAFNRVEVQNASSNVEWTNILMRALGATSRGTFVVTAGTLTMDACTFIDMGTFDFLSSTTGNGCTWRRCLAITAPGSDLQNSRFETSDVAADASAVVWDVNTDVDGLLDGCFWSKGANAHHAIELGTTSPLSVTFRNCDFSGFNASDGQNDSTFYVARGSGTVTINVVGCTGNFTYKSAGATVVIVTDPVTLTITAVDSATGSPIEAAIALVLAGTDFAGGTAVSIARSGSTATVTHTAHGFSTGNSVRIRGANETEYNGLFVITVTGNDTYTYTVSGTPATPATGSPVSALVIIDALTDASGVVTDTRSWSADQAFIGRVKRGSTTPVYKPQPVSGTIDSASGAAVTAPLVSDA